METKHVRRKVKREKPNKASGLSKESTAVRQFGEYSSRQSTVGKPGNPQSDEGIGAHTCSPLISSNFLLYVITYLGSLETSNSKHLWFHGLGTQSGFTVVFIIIIIIIKVYCLHVRLGHIRCVKCPWKPEEGVGTGVIDSCEPPCGC